MEDSSPQLLALTDALVYADEVSDYLPAFKAFTLVPNPTKYKSTDPVHQYKSLLLCLFLKRDIVHTFSKFLFVPELTNQGNVHIHGYYSVKDNIKYNRWFLPACKEWGFINIKNNVDDQWTFEYLTKDIESMAELMDELPVPLHSENIEEHQYLRHKVMQEERILKYAMSNRWMKKLWKK